MLNGSAFNPGSRLATTFSIALIWIQFYSGWNAFETLASLNQCLKIRLQLSHVLLGRAGSVKELMTAWVKSLKYKKSCRPFMRTCIDQSSFFC